MRNHSGDRFCRRCGRPRDEVGGERFSYRGLCRQCGIAGMAEQHSTAGEQVSDPAWLAAWRRGMAAAAGVPYPERRSTDE